ncbi:hypothetical protein [Cognaticolwellia beringensis]|uniref:Glycosyltransferase 2-like domain-containing protein n=1 Tax=Cognaticolwellia beringensis TaxID=1967665 RepID=A0A222G4H7_9GAMM|nr:hypothetical protein [Cognaticolwellia beringensis]ASP46642.1 hypothetical protein B5D82_01910 [Cognaticolwellia beringensis]
MLADVIIFGFNRSDLIEQLLSNLVKCTLANESNVHIFIDGPRNTSDENERDKIRAFLERTNFPFKSTNINYSPVNKGLAKSLTEGISSVFLNTDKVIVLEDDLIIASDFLLYMNKSLDFYDENKRVGSISGYSININYPTEKDNFFHPRPCSWGWATWKDRWQECDWNYDVGGVIGRLLLWIKTRKAGQDVYRMYRHNELGKINSWAILWTISNINSNLLTSYPTKSRVINSGFNENATHCKSDNPFPSKLYSETSVKLDFCNKTKLDPKILKKYNFYFSNIYKVLFRLKLPPFLSKLINYP